MKNDPSGQSILMIAFEGRRMEQSTSIGVGVFFVDVSVRPESYGVLVIPPINFTWPDFGTATVRQSSQKI